MIEELYSVILVSTTKDLEGNLKYPYPYVTFFLNQHVSNL